MPIETRNKIEFPRPAGSGESRTDGHGNDRARDTGRAVAITTDRADAGRREAADPRVPRLSIGLPVYNGGALLRLAIDSVLAQTFTDFELVICDNASTDGTEALCREYARRDKRVRYVRNPVNIGAAKNFNRTFELSRSPLFKWMSHDDVVLPTMVERCVEALDANPDAVLCTVRRRYMEYDGEPCWEDPVEQFHDLSVPQLLRVEGSRFPAYMMGVMRREALLNSRLMDTYVACEVVFVLEMRLQGRIFQMPDELHFQRLPDESDQSRLVRKSQRGEAVFLDPLNAARRLLMPPGVKLLVEMFRAVGRSNLTAGRKARAYREVAEYTLEKFRKVANPRHLWRWVRLHLLGVAEPPAPPRRTRRTGNGHRVGPAGAWEPTAAAGGGGGGGGGHTIGASTDGHQ
ncbi:MAG TPA: glycosyltransferase family 2 protein [Tepidisphaeraceae bacterium]|nr:glycosyltransferase family 2 protein [Tepidisphaeraceae bacterium]